jgi:flagellar basal-body rod modification protein FlgD
MNVTSSTQLAAMASSGAQTQSRTTGPATVDYDAFLKLLVTQMRNQDPTRPTDQAEYLSQLASFSAVEQQIASNRKLDELISALSLGQAATLIGTRVSSLDGSINGVVTGLQRQEDRVSLDLAGGGSIGLADVASVEQG